MTTADLTVVILGVLSAGSAPVINWLLDQIVRWKAEDGQDIAPKTRRRLALLLTAVVPSAMYVLVLLMTMGIQTYDWKQNLAYIATAFTTSQMLHGERKLPDGEEYAELKAEEAKKEVAVQVLEAEGRMPL
jgi:hypothetical protein